MATAFLTLVALCPAIVIFAYDEMAMHKRANLVERVRGKCLTDFHCKSLLILILRKRDSLINNIGIKMTIYIATQYKQPARWWGMFCHTYATDKEKNPGGKEWSEVSLPLGSGEEVTNDLLDCHLFSLILFICIILHWGDMLALICLNVYGPVPIYNCPYMISRHSF